MTYKVSHINIKNLRNVLDVSFDFDDHLVKISGENGAGKSTIVDAIFLSIVGKTYIGRGRSAENLITKNHDQATIECTLSSSGKTLKIYRTINSNGDVKLDITSSDGQKLMQKDLDELLSEFTIDPLEFTRKSKKEQYDIIKNISGVDTTEIDAKIQEQELATSTSRSIAKTKAEALKEHGFRDEVQSVDFTSMTADFSTHKTIIDKYEQSQKDVSSLSQTMDHYDKEIQECENRIESLKAFKAQSMSNRKEAQITITTGEEAYNNAKKSLEEIAEKSQKASEINAKADEYKTYKRLMDERDNTKQKLSENEDLLESMRDRRKSIIEAGDMPVDGLSFDEVEGVLINGLPIDQLSSAQQLLLACKIATSQNPNMKVIYIKDGSLLDSTSMQEIAEIADKEDYQIFVERVGEEVDSIIMRDGASL